MGDQMFAIAALEGRVHALKARIRRKLAELNDAGEEVARDPLAAQRVDGLVTKVVEIQSEVIGLERELSDLKNQVWVKSHPARR